MVGPWAIPRLAVVVLEWPLHCLCSAWAGLAAWRGTFCICRPYSGPSLPVALLCSTWRGFVLLVASALVHYVLDYSGQTFIPAGIQ